MIYPLEKNFVKTQHCAVRPGGHAEVTQQQQQLQQPQPPAYHHSSETATYVNVVNPANTRPPFYHHPPPINPLVRPQVQGGSGGVQPHHPHPGSGGHVPYSPAFQHHPHVRPVGIAIPRQGNTNPETTYHRQSSIGKLTFFCFLHFFTIKVSVS